MGNEPARTKAQSLETNINTPEKNWLVLGMAQEPKKSKRYDDPLERRWLELPGAFKPLDGASERAEMSLPVYRLDLFHKAYCEATGFDLLPNACFDRYWFEAAKLGMTPDDVKLCVKNRIKLNANRQPQFRQAIYIRNLVGSEEAIADSLNEVAAIKATQRKKVFPQGKQDVLRATGRETEPETQFRHISEVFKDIQKQ